MHSPGKPNGIDAVIFDIGRVLLDFKFDRAFDAASSHIGMPAAEVRARLFGSGDFSGRDSGRPVVAFECGKISEEEFHAHVERILECTMALEKLREIWNGIFIGEIQPTVELLSGFRKQPHLKVGILSNTNATHFEHMKSRLPCLREMEHVYASHLIGFRKPDARCFEAALRGMKVQAERSVFVDDLPENVAAARALGMRAIHATDAQSVRNGFSELGLI